MNPKANAQSSPAQQYYQRGNHNPNNPYGKFVSRDERDSIEFVQSQAQVAEFSQVSP